MSLFKRAHNDPRLGLERGRIEEVEVAKECDAVGRRREHFSRDGPLLRDHRDSSKRGVGGSQISGKRFLLTAALQIRAGCAKYHGPIDSITTQEVRHLSKCLKRSSEFVPIQPTERKLFS